MKTLVCSGGASKGAFSAGAVEELLRSGIQFDLAIGTSTGSLVGGPALLNDYNFLANIYTTVANDDILNNSFLGKILGTPIDARMTPLFNLLKKYYLDRGGLKELGLHGKELIVSCVNGRTGKVHYISSRQVTDKNRADRIQPETFVRAVLSSCSEPVFTEPVKVYELESGNPFREDLFYDGGVRDFLPIQEGVLRGASEIWGVSTHRFDHAQAEWTGGTDAHKVSIIAALKWTISTLLDEVARGDRDRAEFYLGMAGLLQTIDSLQNTPQADKDALRQQIMKLSQVELKLKDIYMIYPDAEMGTSLDFIERVMMGYYRAGKRAARLFLDRKSPKTDADTLREKRWDIKEPQNPIV